MTLYRHDSLLAVAGRKSDFRRSADNGCSNRIQTLSRTAFLQQSSVVKGNHHVGRRFRCLRHPRALHIPDKPASCGSAGAAAGADLQHAVNLWRMKLHGCTWNTHSASHHAKGKRSCPRAAGFYKFRMTKRPLSIGCLQLSGTSLRSLLIKESQNVMQKEGLESEDIPRSP